MLLGRIYSFWRQHPTKQLLYGHLPPITKTIKVRRTRHAGHCWWSRDELIRDILLRAPSHGRAKAGRSAKTYIQQVWNPETCRKQWTIGRGGERGSGISVLIARRDDEVLLYISIQLNISHLLTQSLIIKEFYFKQFNLAKVICLQSV